MLEVRNMAGHLIRRLHQISVSAVAEAIEAAGHDLTPVQFAALSAIGARPGIDQATLAGLIVYDRATIGGVVDRLDAKQLLTRAVSAEDRRARVLTPTAEGRRLLTEITPVFRKVQDQILAGLDPDERETMLGLLRKATAQGNALSRAPLKTGKEKA